jgi:hypothetical protein
MTCLARVPTTVALLLVAGAVVAAMAAPAVASDPVVDRPDPHGDVVEVNDGVVDAATEQSVDIRHVTVTRLGSGARFTIRMKKVLPVQGKLFQQVNVQVLARAGYATWSSFDANVNAQHLHAGGAGYTPDIGKPADTISCDILATRTARSVTIFVPGKCLPSGPGVLHVGTALATRPKLDLISADQLELARVDLS